MSHSNHENEAINGDLNSKNCPEQRSHCSRPVSRSTKSRLFAETGLIFQTESQMWQHHVAEKKRKGRRFRLCRLVHYNYDLSKRWYVVFYAWNTATQSIQRKRIFDNINLATTVQKRLEVADEIIRTTNEDLLAGKVLGKEKAGNFHDDPTRVTKFTLLNAVDFFIQEKNQRRQNYLKRFITLKTNLRLFYKEIGADDIPVRKVDTNFCRHFLNWIAKRTSPRTFNNYRNDLRTVLNYVQKRAKPYVVFRENPVADIETMPATSKKHPAFNDRQMREIIEACGDRGHRQLAMFVQFMYYTLARPIELMGLRIRDIEMDRNRILIRSEIAKNRRDEYVTINPRLADIISQNRILEYSPSQFVFGNAGVPGPEPYHSRNHFGKRFKRIMRSLGYLRRNQNYALYGVKHSGAIALYLATKDIYAVKEQCRHTEISQTEAYLRDLGLLRKESPIMAWEGAI